MVYKVKRPSETRRRGSQTRRPTAPAAKAQTVATGKGPVMGSYFRATPKALRELKAAKEATAAKAATDAKDAKDAKNPKATSSTKR